MGGKKETHLSQENYNDQNNDQNERCHFKTKIWHKITSSDKTANNLQPPSSLFCKERKEKQKEEFHSVLYSEFDQQSALSANYWFIAETVQVQSCKVITFLQEGW